MLAGQQAGARGTRRVIAERLERWDSERVVARIWDRDASLWGASGSPPDAIVERLGWLDLPWTMRARADELRAFAERCRDDGYTQVGVLGMGGSSLAPEMFGRVFGGAPSGNEAGDSGGWLTPRVLDSTHPDAVRDFAEWAAGARTLFIVSSKSGTTTEPLAFHAAMAASAPASDFAAITDPGTRLAQLARDEGFRDVIEAPPDVGGRYSALTTFGLVPAALMGVDLDALLARAAAMAERCREAPAANPGLKLAASIGEAALRGRDKVTFLITAHLAAFGDWVEQLIAESTGKLERGVVPVVGERIGEPETYGDDRYFVAIRFANENRFMWEPFLRTLVALRHPGTYLRLRDPLDLGAEIFRWEFATAALGMVLDIDPFDQPNVQESKDATTALLDAYRSQGRLPEREPLAASDGMSAYADPSVLGAVPDVAVDGAAEAAGGAADGVAAALRRLLSTIRPGDYFAILAYLPPEAEIRDPLERLRAAIRDRLGVATTLGFGPRFLHSTGQLHKGGPPSGVFLQLTADPAADLPIPGWTETFGTLVAAQALGDLESLQRRGRRALRVHFSDSRAGIEVLVDVIQQALAETDLPRGAADAEDEG